MAFSLFLALFSESVEISEMVADSSSTALACSVEPCASAWAPVDTWSDPAATCSALRSICASASLRLWLMVLIDWKTE